MRAATIAGLLFLTASAAIGADKPIPQDAARSEKKSKERLEWNRRTTVGAYDKLGKKDPKWDAPAREAMEMAARMFSEQHPPIDYGMIHKKAQVAVDAGCDDPYLLYLYYRGYSAKDHPGEEEILRRVKPLLKDLAALRYPVFRTAGILVLYGATSKSAKGRDEASRNKDTEMAYDAALALLPESAAGDERGVFWEDRWCANLLDLIGGYRSLGLDAVPAYERVDRVFAKLPELKALRLRVRGHFWFDYGWEARTTAFAPGIPAGGAEAFHKRLSVARKAFSEAWSLRQDDARTATFLLDIEKGIGGGDRAAMELWFDRAMKADGDNVNACLTKLDWLDPKWYGDDQGKEMMAFGNACRATKNWRAKITLLAADAHLRYSGKLAPKDRRDYMTKPDVWAEIRDVYDEYLEHFPDDDVARSKYAALCYIAGRYPESHVQFKILGDRLTTWPIFPNYTLPMLKQIRDHVAQSVEGKPAAGAPSQKGDAKP